MKRITASLLAVAMLVTMVLAGTAFGQSKTKTKRSSVSVYDYQSSTYKSYDITTRRTGSTNNVTVFDYQNPGYRSYDITTRGSGRNKSVSVFDYQNPGFKNYDVSVTGTGRTKSVTVFDYQNPGFNTYNVTTSNDDDVDLGITVPLYNSRDKSKTETRLQIKLPSYDWGTSSRESKTSTDFGLPSLDQNSSTSSNPYEFKSILDDDDDDASSDDPW